MAGLDQQGDADEYLPVVTSVCLWTSAVLSIAAWTIVVWAMLQLFGSSSN